MPYISYTPQRPKPYSQPYALPGDSIVPLPELHILDIEAKTNLAVKITPAPNQLTITGSARDSAWSTTSDKVYATWYTRGSKSVYLAAVDARTGVVHVIARDSSKTFVEIGPPGDPASWYVTKDGSEAFWWSERDGWSHLYRLDANGATTVAQSGAPASGASRVSVVNGDVESPASLFRSGARGRFVFHAHGTARTELFRLLGQPVAAVNPTHTAALGTGHHLSCMNDEVLAMTARTEHGVPLPCTVDRIILIKNRDN